MQTFPCGGITAWWLFYIRIHALQSKGPILSWEPWVGSDLQLLISYK